MKEQLPQPNQPTDRPARSPVEWMRWIPLVLLTLIFCIAVFIGARVILVPMLSSLALAYLLVPVVNWFERRGWSRPSSVLLAITSGAVALVLILIFILPGFWKQVTKTYDQARAIASDRSRVQPLLQKLERASPPAFEFLQSQVERFKDPAEKARLRSLIGGWLQSGLFRLVDFTASILDLLLIPFFVYYLLADYGAMRARIDRLIPPRYRIITAGLLVRINNVISSYVRSQLLIALVMGGLYSLGFLALRVPLAITIGMLSGLLNFVPYLGTLTGLALSLSFTALDGAGLPRILGVIVVFIVVQSVEGYYLTPKLLGSSLNLHPLWVLVGLMIGGSLFGLLGIILAVPVIAVTKVVLNFLEDLYQQSDFYRRSGLALVTDQGDVIGAPEANQPTSPMLEEPHPRRTIITTGELRSRIKDNKPSSENE
ncbi:MAG: AI-2E family transporter [Acidobacteria bacterium]|nr:AI-2E family transporter [Acidobacteriota bacterium]